MRPREREEETTPPPRAGGALSSMVVRPPPAEENDGDPDPADSAAASAAAAADNDNNHHDDGSNHQRRRRESSPPPSHHYRREYSSSPGRRRGCGPMQDLRRGQDPSPGGFRRRGSPPPPFHRRGSPPGGPRRGGSPGFQPRYQRFHDGPGYPRAGSVSPQRRQRMDDVRHDIVYDNYEPFGRGFRGGRGGKFRDVSPRYGVERGRRSGSGQRSSPPAQGEYVHRNDPNLSPREGDWICRNPSCGNLNFARRTHCNNCNMYRYGPEMHGATQAPQREYFHSSPPRRSPPKVGAPPIDRGPRRDVDRYRMHPSGWDVEDTRGFGSPSGRGARFDDQVNGERLQYRDDIEYRKRGKFDLPVPEWDGRYNARDRFISDRRGYDRRIPSPGARWAARERSRSPLGDRPPKSSFLERPRGDRRYDSYSEHGRAADSSIGRGRGYRHGDSFPGRGRGGRRGMARGRNNDVF